MAQINLLPWREEARKNKIIRFGMLLLGGAVLAILLVVALHIYFNQLIKKQQARIDFLQAESNKEQIELNALIKRRKQQQLINGELNLLFSLRQKSYQAVQTLDELARIVPDAISFNKLMRKDSVITILGRSTSNLQITTLMQNLSGSHFFTQPVLTEISAKTTSLGEERFFELKTVIQEHNGKI